MNVKGPKYHFQSNFFGDLIMYIVPMDSSGTSKTSGEMRQTVDGHFVLLLSAILSHQLKSTIENNVFYSLNTSICLVV